MKIRLCAIWFSRRCRPLLPFGLALLLGHAPAPANAGDYVVSSQSGGKVSAPNNAYPGASGQETHDYYYTGDGAATGYLYDEPTPPGSYSMKGAITTVFKWQPNTITDSNGNFITDDADVPPKKVVIMETCDVWNDTSDSRQSLAVCRGEVAGGSSATSVPAQTIGFNGKIAAHQAFLFPFRAFRAEYA